MNNAWILLVVAGLLEVGWAIGLKYTDGFSFRTRPAACFATLAAMVASMYMLSVAVRSIPIGTGYAIWTGIGALGAATIGMIFFREPANAARIACLLMVVVGIIGLKLSSPAAAQEPARNPTRSDDVIPFYIGGYTKNGNEGIYRATLNPADGSISAPTLAVEAKNPSFLIMHPKLPVLYSVSEIGKEKGKAAGTVRAFRMNVDGSLIPLAEWLSQGEAPCYVSVDGAGRFLFAANYGDGVAAAFPIDSDGKPGEASFVDRHIGSSVNAKRQEGPHAHSFVPDPSGRFAASCDLGADTIIVYRINGTTIERDSVLKMPAGSGPRHITFSADSRFAYVCTELTNQLATLSFDSRSGRLELLDIQTTLPPDFKDETWTAEVAIHPSGRFVYVSNRGHDSIAVFRIDPQTGKATAAGHMPTGGQKPRHFAVDPSGRFLIAANQESNTLTSFTIDSTSGMPSPTGRNASVGAPSCVRFAP